MERFSILCVDDEEMILSVLKRMLHRENYDIYTATNGEEGLQILQRNKIDLLLIDYCMPGMNGVEFLKEAQKIQPDATRVVITGYTTVDAITEAINEGRIHRIIVKPWDDEELKRTLRSALSERTLLRKNREANQKIGAQLEELRDLNSELVKRIERHTCDSMIKTQALTVYRDTLLYLPVGVLGIDENNSVVYVNQKAEDILRPINSNLLGNDIDTIFPKEVKEMLQKTLKNGKPRQIQMIKIGNKILHIEGTRLYPDSNTRGTTLVFYEIDQE